MNVGRVLFTIAKNLEQHRYPSAGEWLNCGTLWQWLQEVRGEGGMTGWSTGDFQDGETVSYDTVMVVSRHHIFVKIHRMYNTIINGL